MITEQLLLIKWQSLDTEKKAKVLALIDDLIKDNEENDSEPLNYQPKTELGKKLWALRQKSLGSQPLLNNWDEVEKELADRRGGIRE
ncbi:hypothetical protein H6G11_10980 [Cyanobacterium aponinum FACHB-4101]|uniref:Uncharacterized protein n=3 Tax=Cyanobacterium aponinum TaxID=379064 RepID=K9Z6Y5_CYAAP|nr:hypothetical protein Cyan10605_2239 [Cyanobacterium aponinum PCC 10605]MBD2394774.1 hypothetical protein [Cyanobacterium aponinum FACHB-4101]MTF38700.1 hypothetical protein [Cyanobacterium aponinum 0216]PHV62140.1 hypothetical protein CSQ80_12210 [Cyanobacterium aponinum IPPAS B-1201]